MPRFFKTEEEKKAWAQKMREIREQKRAERQKASNSQPITNTPSVSQSQAVNTTEMPQIPGKVWVRHTSGDLLAVPEWLADDMEKRGEAKRV